MSELTDVIDALTGEVERLRAERDQLRAEIRQLDRSAKSVMEESERLKGELADMQAQIDSLQAKWADRPIGSANEAIICAENDRLRAALEQIAGITTVGSPYGTNGLRGAMAHQEMVAGIARAALEGKSCNHPHHPPWTGGPLGQYALFCGTCGMRMSMDPVR